MFTEDSLATAEIAKIFGSELLNVQEKARTDSGAQPDILRMHPTQFLGSSPQQQQQRKRQEALLMQQLQREAESTHPLPQVLSPTPASSQAMPTSPLVAPPAVLHSAAVPVDSEELKKLNINLDRIATILEKSVDLFAKMSSNQ
jgi:hypothetical protein